MFTLISNSPCQLICKYISLFCCYTLNFLFVWKDTIYFKFGEQCLSVEPGYIVVLHCIYQSEVGGCKGIDDVNSKSSNAFCSNGSVYGLIRVDTPLQFVTSGYISMGSVIY